MRIQFNTTQLTSNQTIHITEKDVIYFTALMTFRLEHYKYNIKAIEVHLSGDTNTIEEWRSIRCALSTTVEDEYLQPIIFEADNNNIVLAFLNAIDKLTVSLKRSIKLNGDALHNDERIFNIKRPLMQVVLPT